MRSVTSWLSGKLFQKGDRARDAGGASSLPCLRPGTATPSHNGSLSSLPESSSHARQRARADAHHAPPSCLAQCLLLWEHDTPASATTTNFRLFGTANVPSDTAESPPPLPSPQRRPSLAAAASPPGVSQSGSEEEYEGGGGGGGGAGGDPLCARDQFVSVGPGGRVLARKVVLDCATCDGAFLNVRLYTDSAKLVCSPAVPFQVQ